MCELEIKLQAALIAAMKEKNEHAISAIRSIKTAIQNEKTNGSYHELTDNDIVGLIQKLSKQRQESADIYNEAGRTELAEKELKEKEILDGYLPKMLSENELATIINSIVSENNFSTMKDMGAAMKILKESYPNQYEGKLASTLIRAKLV